MIRSSACLRCSGGAPRAILDVGASNGLPVATLAAGGARRCAAVAPSPVVLADGRARFPEVESVRAFFTALPKADGDLVIVSFVLHWIDRRNLLRAAAEIDRVTADVGLAEDRCPHPCSRKVSWVTTTSSERPR
jgi:SAM-dependent methyltransferase